MTKIKALRIAARRSGFRRAGLAHPAHPVLHPLEDLTEAQIALLKAEPMLVVQGVEIEAPEGAEEDGASGPGPKTSPAPRKGARSVPSSPAKAETAAATEAAEGEG
ncbi:HI1506-related protein [Neomegalonema sp.]|uniref:HI1506-related protein n=1 Tax=Neomegalonema sp. TaxID=2039713 RepID=UPI0026162698|nr:HI1506-related protein [Neomegalonema sp.]MDD2870121.1 HI1506-related protein [Neomegalonema sp.]